MLKRELSRYAVAGALAFASDITVLYICTDIFGWHYLYSNVASYSAGLLVSYSLNVTWVFTERRFEQKSWLEFLLFNVIVLVGFLISEALMALLVELAGMHYLASKVASAIVIVVYNFVAKKLILFSTVALGKQT